MKRRLRTLAALSPVSLTLGTLIVVLCLFLIGVPILDFLELKTYDLRFVSRGPRPPAP